MGTDAKFLDETSTFFHSQLEREKTFPALAVKSVDIEKRQVRVLASSDDLDRHGDRVLPSAFKKRLHLFKANPVILAAHAHRSNDGSPTVVGKAVNVWVDKAGLWAVIEFAETPLAEQYWKLYQGGFMKAVSVGFRVIEFKTEYEEGRHIDVITEAELYEISCVAVPANPAAVVKGGERKKFFVAQKKLDNIIAKNHHSSPADFAKAFLGDDGFDEIEVNDKKSFPDLKKSEIKEPEHRDFARYF